MKSTDALTRLRHAGIDARRQAREAIITALQQPGDPATRRLNAEAAWANAQATIERLRTSAQATARQVAQDKRRDLFDLTRLAPHVQGDLLARQTARETARKAAAGLEDEQAAVEALRGLLRSPNGMGGAAGVQAGAISERGYDAGWDQVLHLWANSLGRVRGGQAAVDALRYAEAVASGERAPDGLEDLPPAREMAESMGREWPDAHAQV